MAGSLLLRVVATFGFIGLIPFAPATWASLVTLLLWLLLPVTGTLLFLPAAGTLLFLPAASTLLFLAIWIILVLLGTFAAHRAERHYGHDDGRVVIDEVAGSLLAVAGFTPRLGIAIAAFVLFRIFDIAKPPPIYQLQAMPGGIGVMADDLAAGLLANVVLRFGLLVVPGLAGVLS
jgi:phosphatidylglycerophosphatase A